MMADSKDHEVASIFGFLPSPRTSDVLFSADYRRTDLNACVEHWGDVNWSYKKGFRRAACQLADRMIEKPEDQDSIVYPIVYLYRHHIELLLKDILRNSFFLVSCPLSSKEEKALKNHALSPLWAPITSHLPSICEKAGQNAIPVEDIRGVGSYLKQMDSLDYSGQSFRYARDKGHKRSLPESLKHINIGVFSIRMEQLSSYLEGLDSWLSTLVEACAD